ncbi:transposase [Amycolatopsis sp. WAC 01375]|uniref:transposase n=1 Tax=Amycolatopsis sp. WAC 01375 TaxID=2203194 RepID=UPI000F792E5E|nr:transposase [Amycolatopsis sp. WAC 01375]RSM80556.1 transposase [Amycolatopsis sp. WAC 01375]
MTGHLDLAPGAVLVLAGVEWTVECTEPHVGRVVLVSSDGQRMPVTMKFLMHHPDCRASTRTAAAAAQRQRQDPTAADLTPHQREVVTLRLAHLLEVETGFRAGDPLRSEPGEPRPGFDPAATTVNQRREAKVTELAGLDRTQARLLGLDKISVRTLARWAGRYRRAGSIGCADDRWLRRSGGHPSVTETVREAIYAVHAETLHRSRMSMRARERLIHQYVREQHGSEATAQIPSYETLRLVWADWFGSGGGRQRYVRSAAKPTSGQHVVIHRPGQVVAMDTTILPVKVRETVFGDPVSVHLTLALDVYTRSLVAFRLTLVSDSSVDVAMVLRDIMMPLPMRPDWGDDLEWPYPGLPANVVAEFAGHRVAGLPFFSPETVTTDHGSVYRNHHLVEVERVIGANILPARVLRPTDKQAVERAFGSIRSLLFEVLPGYSGVDVYDRGVDPEADATLTIDAMEHLIATWIVSVWQNRRLGEHAPSWDPAGDHSPNTLFAAAMNQGGFAMQIPAPELYYQLLPAHHVVIHGQRGVKIRGLFYDGPALDPYRHEKSARGGRHKGKWQIRRDPRDARTVFFQDQRTHAWHTLRWTGLPPEDEVPAFSDARARDLLAAARAAGLKPRSDTELLPLLLDLLGAHVPVESWPTLAKAQRTELARDTTQGRAASADRVSARPLREVTAPRRSTAAIPTAAPGPASWPQHFRAVEQAVDGDRRRRREALGDEAPARPARLGDAFRRGNLFLLADDPADTAEGDS